MATPLHFEVLPLRQASREVVRELGFLEASYAPGMPHSHWHAMVEIESGGLVQSELSARLRLDKSTTSRIVERLVKSGFVRVLSDAEDGRRGRLQLTAEGKRESSRIHTEANTRVQRALDLLSAAERATVLSGMSHYARVLERARRREGFTLRPIRKDDSSGVERVIRTVMPEFGASGPGFAIHDAEVSNMFKAYSGRRCAYFVLLDSEHTVVGGGGIAPLQGAKADTCELRKMYLLSEARGLGFGEILLSSCLEAAISLGYSRCYLETLKSMRQARAMYEKHGFKPLGKPEGATGHFGCDAWYSKDL